MATTAVSATHPALTTTMERALRLVVTLMTAKRVRELSDGP